MNDKVIPITRQCELVGLNRSSFYYRPYPVSDFNLHLMTLIDRLYTKDPSLRCLPDDKISTKAGVQSQPETGISSYAIHGYSRYRTEEKVEPAQ
jgi:hypothetical protein